MSNHLGEECENFEPIGGHWRFEKKINLTHLLTTITILIGFFVWAAKLDTRITLVEQATARQMKIDERQDVESKDQVTEVKADIKEIKQDIKTLLQRTK